MNHKRLERIYRQEGLAVRRLRRKRLLRPATPMTNVHRPTRNGHQICRWMALLVAGQFGC